MNDDKKKNGDNSVNSARRIFRSHHGLMRTSEILRAGIHPRTLYAMRKDGVVDQLGRGLYRISDARPLSNPDLVVVARRCPRGVICLISALSFHNLTTQIPHDVYLAIPRGTRRPAISHPPVRIFHMPAKTFDEGIETHMIDGVQVRVFSPEKTIADCFKYRSRIGMDTVIEALKFYRQRRKVKIADLLHYADICRIDTVIKPYLEAAI